MDKDEIKKCIAELEPQAEAAWEQFQAYEASDEYKQAHAKHEHLNKAWYALHTKVAALKTLRDSI